VDSITQIVRIRRGNAFTTGLLLENCRVLTTVRGLRALIDVPRSKGIVELGEENLVAEMFEFETRPLAQLGGRAATGVLVILGHGHVNDYGFAGNAVENWAVGYDEDCLGENHRLGHFLLGHAHSVSKTGTYVTAGYSGTELSIDSACSVTGEANRHLKLTNCSVARGGLGQPLFRPLMFDGHVVESPLGRPYLVAYGMTHSIDTPSVVLFTDEFLARIRPFLTSRVRRR
jgi:hypothetical protein